MLKSSVSLLFTIVDRGKGEAVADLLHRQEIFAQWIVLGNGTAHKDLLGILGLRDTAKDIVISFLAGNKSQAAMNHLRHALDIDLPGRGIAFTIPIGSMSERTLQYLTQGNMPASAEGEKKLEQQEFDLIMAIVNRGFTDDVMNAARPAGAQGGTILHARGAGAAGASRFFGITITPEKEMVLILVSRDVKNAVMQAISKQAGINSEAHGFVFSLPVDDVIGLTQNMPVFEEGVGE